MITVDYIRGFADGDGCFSQPIISLVNTEPLLLERIKRKLAALGIKARLTKRGRALPKHKDAFALRIHGYRNLKRWQQTIGFGHPKKRRRLAEYLSYMERPGGTYNWEESERATVLRSQGYSWRAIGKELGIGHSTIYMRFRRGLWPLSMHGRGEGISVLEVHERMRREGRL